MIKYESNAEGKAGGPIAQVGQAIGGVLSGLNINTGGRKTGKGNELIAASQAAAIQNQQKLETLKTVSSLKNKNNNQNTIITIVGIIILGIFIYISLKK